MTREAKTKIGKLMEEDKDLLRQLVQEAVQQMLEEEMTATVGAAKGERTGARRGYRSGYYERNLITRVGTLEIRVPQDRDGKFSTELFERYSRSEKALVGALVEMYVHGVSTRKVKAITEELCGHEFSPSAVSRMNAKLDESLTLFAEGDRRLNAMNEHLLEGDRRLSSVNEHLLEGDRRLSASKGHFPGGDARSSLRKEHLLVGGRLQ